MSEIKISVEQLEHVSKWIKTFGVKPEYISIVASPTSIGVVIRVEVATKENEGRYLDITDYENW